MPRLINANYAKVDIQRDPNLTAEEYKKVYQREWIVLNRKHFNASSGLTYYKNLYGKEKIHQYCMINDNNYHETLQSIKMDILTGKLKKLPT